MAGLQLFRQKFFTKATMAIDIMGSNSSALPDWGSRRFNKNKGESISMLVLKCVFLEQTWTTITHNTFSHGCERFYVLAGEPFSKQLFVTIFKW